VAWDGFARRPWARTLGAALVGILTTGLGAGCENDNPPACEGAVCVCGDGQSCDLSGTACEGIDCLLTCASENLCRGECGDECVATCTGASTCELATGVTSTVACDDASCAITLGPGSHVSCGQRASCELDVGESGSITCTGRATCTIRCSGACTVSCAAGDCELQCPGDAAPAPVGPNSTC